MPSSRRSAVRVVRRISGRRRRRLPGLDPQARGLRAPAFVRSRATVHYAELHCHSNFSFLDGASQPEELAEEGTRLGLTALAVTDHDGFYGVVRFAEAARELGLPTVFGAELSLELPGPQNGEPDPAGRHLLVLARGPEGYARLSTVIAEAHLRGGEKGQPVYDLEEVAAAAARPRAGAHRLPQGPGAGGASRPRHGRRGQGARRPGRPVRRGQRGGRADQRGDPLDSERNDALAEPRRGARAADGGDQQRALRDAGPAPPGHRARRGPGPAQPGRDGRLAARRGHRPPALRRGDGARFARYPGAVARAAALGAELAFDLQLVSAAAAGLRRFRSPGTPR